MDTSATGGSSSAAPSRVAAAFDVDQTLTFTDRPARLRVIRVSSVIGLLAYAGYLVYRACFTINHDALVFSLLVYFAEVHGFFSLFFFFHEAWAVRGRRVPPAPEG